MTARENFVARWARLKRNASRRGPTEELKDTPTLSTSDACTEAGVSQPRNDAATTDEQFDPDGLPSIEAITANTDIRQFLQSRVPGELTRAALRRAWASDPAIRDFIGIAENQWDFNDPNAIPGFGSSLAQDSAPALLAQALGGHGGLAEILSDIPLAAVERSLPAAACPGPTDRDEIAQSTPDASTSLDARGLRDDGSPEGTAVDDAPVAEGNEFRRNGRSHGGALPR